MRAFVGDRIRMFQIKKMGSRQRYYSAKVKIVVTIEVF